MARAGAYYLVTDVADGRTVVVSTNERVRLIGLSLPGGPEPGALQEAVAWKAERMLRELALNQIVRLEFDGLLRNPENGDLLAYVYIKEGPFLNAAMLERGMARLEMEAPNETMAERLKAAEAHARENQLGVWSTPEHPDPSLPVIANRASRRFHMPGGLYYREVLPENRIFLPSAEEARRQGFEPGRYR